MSTFNEDIAEVNRAFHALLAVVWADLEPTVIGRGYRLYIHLLDKLEAWLKAQEEETDD